METNIHLYEIGASEWRPSQGGGGWRHNLTFNIITSDVERALALFAEAHPDAEVHRIEKRDRVENVMVDPLITLHPEASDG